MIGLELIVACAATVAPATIQRVIWVESKGNPLAIGVNGGRLPRQPIDAADAAVLARTAIRQGYSVDLGLMQVNSSNLARLGYSVEDMFEPCKNMAAGSKILTDFYVGARATSADDQTALRAALSAYNTGSYSRGFRNGYVGKYFQPSGRPNGRVSVSYVADVRREFDAPNPYTSSSVVFIRGQEATTMQNPETIKPVISTTESDASTPGVQIEHTAESAERNGAFEETAMTEAEAWESNTDIHATAIMVAGARVGAAKE